MLKSKMYRIFEKTEKEIVKETNRRISTTGRPHTKQDVLNDMVMEYPVMLKKLKDLQ